MKVEGRFWENVSSAIAVYAFFYGMGHVISSIAPNGFFIPENYQPISVEELKDERNSKNYHQQAIHREVLSQSQPVDPEASGEENNEPVG